MSINILSGTKETLDSMKGQKFIPHEGEGVVYIKMIFLKPDTVENGDPTKVVTEAPGVIVCGQLLKIKEQIDKWFVEAQMKYTKTIGSE